MKFDRRPASAARASLMRAMSRYSPHRSLFGRLPRSTVVRRPLRAAASLGAVSVRVCPGRCGTFVVRAAMGRCIAWPNVSVVVRVVQVVVRRGVGSRRPRCSRPCVRRRCRCRLTCRTRRRYRSVSTAHTGQQVQQGQGYR